MSHRSGNALVLAFGITAMVASMVVISATSSSQVVQSNVQRTNQLRCMAAVEAVLQRREAAVIAMAQNGALLTWTGAPGQPPNLGEDLVGGCRVRWKIEPMRTLTAAEAPGAPASLPYVLNPSPNVSLPVTDPDQAPNQVTYLYQIAAEAVMLESMPVVGDPNPPPVLARAQGARAISATNNPLFRYVINYAARGPKGDLELSHGPDFNVTGNVYSGGSIFIGANVAADDWFALNGPTGSTTIESAQPAPSQARVWGLDGIYRMSKPLAVARLNNLPINNGLGNLGTITDTYYDLTTAQYPNEAAPPDLTSFATATNNGRVINPRRIKEAVGVIPPPGLPRTINGVEVLSIGNDGNDSRDLERSATRAWASTSYDASATTFGAQVQSLDTGATAELIDPQIAGEQALEAQLLVRVEADGDPSTDEHELYRPLFVANDGTTSTTIPNGQPVEAPGVYMGFALGDGLGMRRLADNSGWEIVNQVGGGTPPIPESGSLIIRERLIPDTNLWPGAGGNPNAIVPANHPDYLPYAYGKHWRPTVMPATPIDVTENLMDGGNDAAWSGILTGGDSPPTQRTANVPGRSVNYLGRGVFSIEGAARLPETSTQTMTASIGSSGQSYERVNAFMTDNWRMVHLKSRHGLTSAQILALPQGLRANVWIGDDLSRRLLGIPTWSGLDAQLISSKPAAAGLPSSLNHYSARWDGYLIPPVQGPYTLGISHDDGARIWIDDQLVYERWQYPGSLAIQTSETIPLSPERPARIVVEFYEGAGGDHCSLSWTYPGQAMTLIPSTSLRAAPEVSGFSRTQFNGVAARIDLNQLRASGPASKKAGLMIREAHGTPNMVSGRDRYVALAVNPDRGIFLERRMQPSGIERRTGTSSDFWILNGEYTANSDPAVATVDGKLGIPTDRNNTIGAVTYAVTRTGRITLGQSTFTPQEHIVTNVTSLVVTTLNTPSTAGTVTLSESSQISGFRYGAWIKKGTEDWTARKRWRIRGNFTYPFIDYTGAYPPAPYLAGDRPQIRFFSTAAPGTGTTTTVFQTWNGGYGVGTLMYGGVNCRALTRARNGNEIFGDWSPAKPMSANSGDSRPTAIWKPSGGWPSGWTGGQVVDRLNELNWNGDNEWHLGSQTDNLSNRNGEEPGDPNPPDASFTTDELADPTGILTNPAPHLTAGEEYSFSVPTTLTYTLDVDINPRIGAGSEWGTAPVAQTRPWLDAWSTNFMLTPPMTRSFRPDLWWSAQTLPLSAEKAIQARTSDAPAGTPAPPLDDVIPTTPTNWATWGSVWLRIQHAADGTLTPQYASGDGIPGTVTNPWQTLPVAGGLSLGAASGGAATDDVWSNSLLVGFAIQSGSNTQPTATSVTGAEVQTTEAIGNNDGLWNATDWDATPLPGMAGAMSRYMASQYQVFFANQDITEDFFSWADQVGGEAIATEDWFYNTREFWSQNRRWDNGVEKDTIGAVYSHAVTTNRQLLAKSTQLIINQQRLWEYLRTRTLPQAMTAIMDADPVPAAGADPTLAARFNGLVYAVRTNRYPFNPDAGGVNPWSGSGNTMVLPNGSVATQYANLETTDVALYPDFLFNGVHKLQPYGLAVAPPFRPQQFHHGVMLTNGQALDWGDFTPTPPAANPPLGTGATSIVTPNQLYVVGDLNTTAVMVDRPNGPPAARPVPMSIMGDSINFMSSSFRIADYKTPGFTTDAAGFTGTGILSQASGRPVLTSTTYNAAIVTYNQPSSLARVREGQSAAVIDTMLFMEDWSAAGVEMIYTGSLVVLGTRRYTESFLCNVQKSAGRTPFGTIGWLAAEDGIPSEWGGLSMQVYSAPERVLNYNPDLLTPQGTPPFAPSGVTTASVGGWVRVIQ